MSPERTHPAFRLGWAQGWRRSAVPKRSGSGERRVLDAAALEAHLKGSNVAALATP